MWRPYKYIPIFVAVTCVICLVQAQELFQVAEKRDGKYCGTMLADMLSLVCMGRYNTKIHKKSSYDTDSDEDYGYAQLPPFVEDGKLQFPYRSKPNAASLISGTFRRYTRGVYDECCRKSCTLAEMRSYCAA